MSLGDVVIKKASLSLHAGQEKNPAHGGAGGLIDCKRSGDSNQTSLRLFEAGRHFAFEAQLILGQKRCDQPVFNGSGTTSNGLQLIEGQFGVGHGSVWCGLKCGGGSSPLDVHTISEINDQGDDPSHRQL